jgi:hypothetical protein
MEHSINKAQRIEVIKIEFEKGEGTKNSPFRGVVQYWTLDGELITEIDKLKELKEYAERIL